LTWTVHAAFSAAVKAGMPDWSLNERAAFKTPPAGLLCYRNMNKYQPFKKA